MIRLRTAATLAAGAVAALALGGTALASGNDDPSNPAVEMLPNGDVVASPSPSSSDDSSDDSPSPSASESSAPTTAPSSSAPAASSPNAINLDAAKAIALTVAGGGRVTRVESETEHGRAVWDVRVLVGGVRHDIDVDQATGAVVRHKTDAKDDRSGRSGADDNSGGGSDDSASDDSGRRHGGHGADDTGSDDRGGHGSDD